MIGSSLKALAFAFNNELPVFFSEAQRPFRFDYLEPGVDLSFLKLESTEKTLKTFEGDKMVGLPKELLWERIFFLLSLKGSVPLANLCKSMRYDGDTMIFSDEYSKLVEATFNQCYYFGDKNCYKLLSENKVDTDSYICYDWIAFNRGGKHGIDFIETNDDFVKQIWFYPSDRIDGSTAVKDACVVSLLTKEQLSDFDYSETMARFKTIHEMEERGMKGKFNGYGPSGRPKHYKFRTTHITRRTTNTQGKIYEKQENVEIPNCSEKDCLEDLSSTYVAYDRFLRAL